MALNEAVEIIEGFVEEIIYYNENNGYTVCDFCYNDLKTTAVGCLPCICVGDSLKLTGKWTVHIDYGKQFKVDFFEKVAPKTIGAIEKYLSSGIIKGIRSSTAQKIVKKFKEQALYVLEFTPERLAEIKGISEKKAILMGKSFVEQKGIQNLVMFLQKYNITPSCAVKIYKQFGENSISKIRENPYILSKEVYGIGFKTADKLAITMGICKNNAERIKAGIKYILSQKISFGHTFFPKNMLIDEAKSLLMVTIEEAENGLISLAILKEIVIENYDDFEAVFLSSFYNSELMVARKLHYLQSESLDTEILNINEKIISTEKEIGITLAKEQKKAVLEALSYGVLVITGGPGTGKTTIINTIINITEKENLKIMLAAPTGRAAKRITELCGREAKTIHRLLEIGFSDNDEVMQFYRNEENPLDCDVIIIDEMSMVDILLMNSLLKAVKKGTRLIMVGDCDQLPSVGAGNVLKDIIKSGVVKTVCLYEIFRQAAESMIVLNAHNINNGKYPILNKKDKDFYFLKRENTQDIVSTIIDLCKNRVPESYKIDSISNIQVLSPMRKSPCGITNLNLELQNALNPPKKGKPEKQMKDFSFRVGDKVMQIKNNYNIEYTKQKNDENGCGVFNGDTGIVYEIDFTDEALTVLFDDEKLVKYEFSNLEELELAYAVTIHKSQGSEFPVVIIPMAAAPPMLLSRNLFYTAVTRAKSLVILVGYEQIIKKMVDNNLETKRYSNLLNKLKDLIE